MKKFFEKYKLRIQRDATSLASFSGTQLNDTLTQFQNTDYLVNIEDEKSLILNLCDLFNEIDFNGDKLIDWEDFTSYLIEAATDQYLRFQNKIKEVSHIIIFIESLSFFTGNLYCSTP